MHNWRVRAAKVAHLMQEPTRPEKDHWKVPQLTMAIEITTSIVTD